MDLIISVCAKCLEETESLGKVLEVLRSLTPASSTITPGRYSSNGFKRIVPATALVPLGATSDR